MWKEAIKSKRTQKEYPKARVQEVCSYNADENTRQEEFVPV